MSNSDRGARNQFILGGIRQNIEAFIKANPDDAFAIASAVMTVGIELMRSMSEPTILANVLASEARDIHPHNNVIPIRRHLALVDAVQAPCDAPEGAA